MSETLQRLAAYDPPGGAGRRRSYVLLDVFTDAPLEGNQLAVFTAAAELDAGQMQRIARELNLSETVFLQPSGAGADVRARIFTPAVELPFAGHPVLGTAAVVASATGRDLVTLETGRGPVRVRMTGPRAGTLAGWMEQPLPSWEPFERVPELLDALGTAGTGLPVHLYDNGPRHVCVELESEPALSALRPDLQALAAVGELTVSCFAGAGTATGPAGTRWRSRVFAPALGVAEDPATGSAAGPLAVHLCRHGRARFGAELAISQGREVGRPSLLRAVVRGDAERLQAVEVGGDVVIVGGGFLLLP